EFLNMNNFKRDEIIKNEAYDIYVHESSGLVIDIHKSIILKDRFIVMSCFGGEWQKIFQPKEINDLKNAVIEIISIQTT
ncbi:MAG: hypothetical protein K0R94_110, partial [Burkholderiales bacterium]|nr:hypothetical protein [Burkholderiales bacterium]